jgi:phosphoribosylformylglycinamidine synthase
MERGKPPVLDLELEKAVQETCLEAITKGIIKSAHDCSEGGLAVALAESCVSGEGEALGADIALEDEMRRDALLFGESQSRIIVSINAEDLSQLKEIADRQGAPLTVLGEVGGESLRINIHGGPFIIDLKVREMKERWVRSLEEYLRGE